MTRRKVALRFGGTLILVGGLLFGTSLSQAAPVYLGDSTLDQVTAGSSENSGSGGAIIGNSSEATINQTGGVTLSDEAQMGAKGLNMVNSAESTVANGVNVWDIKGSEVSPDSGKMKVVQTNIINQEQRRSASMPNYSRPEADTMIVVDRSGSESHNDSLDRNNNIVDYQALTSDKTTKSTAWVDTTIKGGANVGDDTQPRGNIDTNVGKGGAGAGVVDLNVDGGEAHIGLAVAGPVTAHPDVVTPLSGDTSDSYGGMDVDGADLSLYGRLILPDVTMEINGAGCGVAMGSCGAGGETTESTTNTTDNSVMDNEKVSSVGDSQFTDNSSESYRSPFELSNAQAEYIVVDDSSLAVNTTFNLTLTGSAQSNASGMNIVNATGSAVADGVNVARTSILAGGAMALTQSNVISHSR